MAKVLVLDGLEADLWWRSESAVGAIGIADGHGPDQSFTKCSDVAVQLSHSGHSYAAQQFRNSARPICGLSTDTCHQQAAVGRREDYGIKLSNPTKFILAARVEGVIVSRMAKHEPDLSLLFHALADPTRRSILTRLAEGPAPVTELANPTGLRLPTVMRHLSVLETAGLIATSKDGRVRSCAIVPEALAPVRTWLDEQQAIWEDRLDRMDEYVMKLMEERAK